MNAIEYVPMQVSMSVHKAEKQAHKPVAVQNGSVLYGKAEPGLVPEGWHLAELIDVRRFANAFGERAGLVFSISTGGHAGHEIMESAALSSSPRVSSILIQVAQRNTTTIILFPMSSR